MITYKHNELVVGGLFRNELTIYCLVQYSQLPNYNGYNISFVNSLCRNINKQINNINDIIKQECTIENEV